MTKKFVLAGAAVAALGLGFGSAEAQVLKRGIVGKHCFESTAAIAKEVWVEVK